MPRYEYKCDCGQGVEVTRSFNDFDLPEVCECDRIMERLMSPFSFAMGRTARGMALDTLNSPQSGMPNKYWKPAAEKLAAAGL